MCDHLSRLGGIALGAIQFHSLTDEALQDPRVDLNRRHEPDVSHLRAGGLEDATPAMISTPRQKPKFTYERNALM